MDFLCSQLWTFNKFMFLGNMSQTHKLEGRLKSRNFYGKDRGEAEKKNMKL